jgi:hypothetical protein
MMPTTSVAILSLLQRAQAEDAVFSPLACRSTIGALSRTLPRLTAPVVETGKG